MRGKTFRSSYCYLAIIVGGSGVGFLVQCRKFEGGFDSLLNVRLFILMAFFSLATYLAWELESLVLARLFALSRQEVKKWFSLSFLALAMCFLYPLARRLVFTNWQTGFRYMALSVFLLFLVAQTIAFARIMRIARKRRETFYWGHLIMIVLCMAGLYSIHQMSYSRAHSGTWSDVTIDHVTRRAVIWCAGKPYRFFHNVKHRPEAEFCFAVGPVKMSGAQNEQFRLELTLRNKDGARIEKKSLTMQMGDQWEEVSFEIGVKQENEISAEIRFTPAGVLQKMQQLVAGLPWREPEGLIAFTQPRMVARQSNAFPNVVLISIDTLRADHVGAYGHFRATPGIDMLAKDGMVFTNVISAATWTLPSHMSMMTSLYPAYHGLNKYESQVSNLPYETLAGVFQANGYACAAFTGAALVSSKYGFSKGFDSYYEEKKLGREANEAEEVFRRTTEWMGKHGRRRFFLFVHTFEAHDYPAVKEAHSIFTDPAYQGIFQEPFLWVLERFRVWWKGSYDTVSYGITEEDVTHVKDLYDGGIRVTDRELQKFLIFLRTRDLYENTLIVLTSDHGESFGDPHNNASITAWNHINIPYREQVWVPLVMKPPSTLGISQGMSFDERISSLDIAPSILEICGLSIPEQFMGIPVVDALLEGNYDSKRSLFAEEPLWGAVALYTDTTAYIHYPDRDRDDELYDMQNDPNQTRNLIDTVQAKPELEILKQHLREGTGYREEMLETVEEMDAELEKNLRALGYL